MGERLMADEKKPKKYVCVTPMDFEGLKGKPHVEAGKPIPDGLTKEQIKEYLEGGMIKEVD